MLLPNYVYKVVRGVVLTLSVILLPLASYAELICPTERKAEHFNRSDAVVLAYVESVQETAPSSRVDIAQLKVIQYWKLRNGGVPTSMSIGHKGLDADTTYLLFLSYDDHEKENPHYRSEVCSPIVKFQTMRDMNIDSVLYLKDLPVHTLISRKDIENEHQ